MLSFRYSRKLPLSGLFYATATIILTFYPEMCCLPLLLLPGGIHQKSRLGNLCVRTTSSSLFSPTLFLCFHDSMDLLIRHNFRYGYTAKNLLFHLLAPTPHVRKSNLSPPLLPYSFLLHFYPTTNGSVLPILSLSTIVPKYLNLSTCLTHVFSFIKMLNFVSELITDVYSALSKLTSKPHLSYSVYIRRNSVSNSFYASTQFDTYAFSLKTI